MKKTTYSLVLLGTFSIANAYAEGSVSLYGVLDAGVNYISNDGGKANWTMTTGVLQGNRWGLKGIEDLGGGMRAIFQIENGFSLGSGALGQGGREFGRQAWVGVSSDRYGTVTLGRQYDSVVDYVQVLSSIVYTGLAHPFDNDNLDNDFRINNAIKYTSSNYGGFKFGGLYAFSNAPNGTEGSGFASNRTWSLGASYSGGALSLGAGYIHLNAPNSNTTGAVSGDYINVTNTSALHAAGLASAVLREDVWAAAANYQFSALKFGLVYSHSKFNSAQDSLKFDNYEANVSYQITPFALLSGSYCFTDGKLDSSGVEPKYHQVTLTGDYFLSKRTDVYLIGAYQRAAGGATVASIAPDTFGAGGSYAPDASTSKNQLLIRLGIRHKF
ncbi:porin [Paraburkholderia aromaticivorans]|uniref:porin n=1 Tax=Paraburkholderia aromaticivorans TaxID=2026199 RepID=UPI0014560552|nr:porin [Paraburkholderia aromaticivorans]